MTLYLSMNGTSDQLKTPSITFNKIVLDIITNSSQPQTNYTLIDARSGSSGLYESGFYTGFSAKLNGVSNNSNFSTFPKDTRITVELNTTSSALYTDDVNIFSRNNNTNYMKGSIYSVKFYNGATLVAHYDMSTGTVQDVSGNGNHATLTGGTWVDDGAGGGTTLTVSLSDSITLSELITKSPSKRLSDSITLSDTLSKSLTVTVVDTVSMGDASTASQGGKSASLSDTVIVTDAIVKKVISTYKNDAVNLSDVDNHTATKQLLDSIASSDTITVSNGKSIILSDTITVTDAIFKAVNVLKDDSITLTDSTSKTAKIGIYDVLITSDDLSILNPQAPAIIGTIHLKGSAILNVYLVGSQTLNVNLKGGIS